MNTRNKLVPLVFAACLCACSNWAVGQINSDSEFKITIYREYSDGKCTSGYLAVNGTIICYALERPWRDNQENVSSIPNGSYPAILRYDKSDHWRLQLENVPDRTGIQIHIGNQPNESEGCILVGATLDRDLCKITNSATAYGRLKKEFYGTDNPVRTPNKTITVIVTGRQH